MFVPQTPASRFLLGLILVLPGTAWAQSMIRAGQFTDAEWSVIRAKYPSNAAIDTWRPLVHPRTEVTEVPAALGNQTLARVGYVDVTAAPFNADRTGATDATTALQAAIEFARDHQMVAYLPVGDYKVSDTLVLRQLCYLDADGNVMMAGDVYPVAVKGETPVSGARARILLADESWGFDDALAPKCVVRFTNVSDPGRGAMIEAFSNAYNYAWHSVDIVIGQGNPGAVALFARSAEGSTVQDVTIDATHGHTGLWSPPGSGGSTSGLTVIGGRVGIETRRFPDREGPGIQPSPSFSDVVLRGQTEHALYVLSRGATVMSGFRIEVTRPGPAIGLREHWFAQPYDSTLVLVDGVIDFATQSGANVVVEQPEIRLARSFAATNVHVRQAALLDNLSGTAANLGGWRLYRELAVHVPPTAWNDRPWSERIFVDGAPLAGNVIDAVDGIAPPSDLLARHQLPKPFPSIDTPGAILITAHGAVSEGTDSRTAIVAAIGAAGASGTVIVPRGNFYVRNTISLQANTRFVGIHPIFSSIRGRDEQTTRFGANSSPATVGIPIVQTVDSATAAPVVGRLSIQAPNTVRQHAAQAVGCYPLRWRSGPESVFNTVRFRTWSATNWRLSSVLNRLTSQGGLGLVQTTSPTALPGGLTIAETHVLNTLTYETFGTNRRLVTKYPDPTSRLAITRTGGGTFSLTSLDLAHGDFDIDPRHVVTLTATFSGGGTATRTYDFGADGQPNLRDVLIPIAVSWTNLTRVDISSSAPFGIDNVFTSLGTETFDTVTVGSSISVFNGDYRRGYEHYPFAANVHPQVLVTGNGGGKWFNLWYHGDVWAQRGYRHVLVSGNQSRLDIHHWHLQHIHADAQAEFRNATKVSVYSIKHEHNCRFLDVVNSRHVRIFGNGGISSAEKGQAHFRFVDSEDFTVVGMGDEVHLNYNGENVNNADNPLIWWDPSLYDGIEEFRAGVRTAPPTFERPLVYRRGRPIVATPPVEAWLLAAGLAANANLAGDTTGAGIPLLLRYASGIGAQARPAPLVPGVAAGLPVVQAAGDSVALRFRRRRGDATLSYVPEVSDLVGAWTPVASVHLGVTPVDAEWEEVTATAPMTVSGRTFLRLRVELAP